MQYLFLQFFFVSLIVLDIYPVAPVLPEGTSYLYGSKNNAGFRVSFSETSHFFICDVVVEITSSKPNSMIFYTTDGSMPTIYDNKYIEPLRFSLKEDTYVVVVRAIAVYQDLITSPVTHSFFVGEDVYTRFGTLVFSLSINNEYLFDHDIGIFVDGRLRENFILENPDVELIEWLHPANFFMRGRESERPVYIEMFTLNGERLINQSAGLRVHGATSRSLPQKNLRLIARREYSPESGSFHFDFFNDEYTINGIPLTSFDRLILRNSGTNWIHGVLNNYMGSVLARNAGFRVVTPVRASTTFINGEFYGFQWINVRIDDHYLQGIFNAQTRRFDTYGANLYRFYTDAEQVAYDLAYLLSFAYKDLDNEDTFEKLNAIVCIDDLLLYYAIQLFLGNQDWPHNNLRRWRYVGEQVPNSAAELDGRWRFVMWDLDATLGINDFGRDTFLRLFNDENPASPLLKNILTRSDMANEFVMLICDLAANVINYDTVAKISSELFNDNVWREIDYWAGRWNRSMDAVENNRMKMYDFVINRAAYLFYDLSQYFGFNMEMYTVTVFEKGGYLPIRANIGTQYGVSSKYFNHLAVPIRPSLAQFTEFDHWILNGERIYYPYIIVSSNDAINGVVKLELVTVPAIPPLVIYELYVTERGNGMVLVNISDGIADTRGLYLSDCEKNLFLWQLPFANVPPGGKLELAGRRSSIPGCDLFRVRMGFDVREGRRFFLSDETGRILDTFTLRARHHRREL